MHYTPVSASDANLSHSAVRSWYPCQLVEVTAEGPTGKLRANITFEYLGAPPFDASANEAD